MSVATEHRTRRDRVTPVWKKRPAHRDFPASAVKLTHKGFSPQQVQVILALAHRRPVQEVPAETILMLTQEIPIPLDDRQVQYEMSRVRRQRPLSPVILVRVGGTPSVILADGHHRTSTCFWLDPQTPVHAVIV